MRDYRMRWLMMGLLMFGACKLSMNRSGDAGKIKQATSGKGIVVSANCLASGIGMDILNKNGNAIDAAIAVLFALAVVYPEAGNIGGGGFMIYHEKSGKTYALDFREKAPEIANKQFYLDGNGDVIDSLVREGIFAAGVPGTVDGIFQMFEKFSKLKDIQLIMKPSIDLADRGFPLSKSQASSLNDQKNRFLGYNMKPTSFVRNQNWKQGDVFKQKELAETLTRIAANGRDEFYKGKTADCILNTISSHGVTWISRQDLNAYHSVWRDPISIHFRDYTILSMPPPSSGGIHLAQLFGMYDLYDHSTLKFHSAKHIQLFTELERRVYADRAKYLGDPDFYNVPVHQLLNKVYLKQRVSDIDLKHASDSKNFLNQNEGFHESEETTHFSIIDKEGNAVSITTTLNGSYGSFVVTEGAGFLLNNEMDDFSIVPGVPNSYGLIGSKANAIEPHKRMLSSMTPTIVLKNNNVEYILGTPGGSTIITSVFQVLMNLMEFELSPYDAVQSKRFHHQLVPDCIYFEEGDWNQKLFADLNRKGYRIEMREPIGRVELIARDGDSYIGIADNRGDDCVVTGK